MFCIELRTETIGNLNFRRFISILCDCLVETVYCIQTHYSRDWLVEALLNVCVTHPCDFRVVAVFSV